MALYLSTPHEPELEALKDTLDRIENKFISTQDLIKMDRFILQSNYFEFNGIVKQQISGTAVGTKFALTYTYIFMDKLETDFLNTQEYLPLVWYRYIDDIFFIWTHGEEKLKFFLADLNKYHPNINFTHESNKECINFLDLKVSLLDNKLSTDLYIKPTDRHQYLHYSSSHPDHTKKLIVYSQTLRLNRICSVEADFVWDKKEMKLWFLKQGYPEKMEELLDGIIISVNDVSIIVIDKTDPIDPLKREHYWRHTLKALVPYGLNISESAWLQDIGKLL